MKEINTKLNRQVAKLEKDNVSLQTQLLSNSNKVDSLEEENDRLYKESAEKDRKIKELQRKLEAHQEGQAELKVNRQEEEAETNRAGQIDDSINQYLVSSMRPLESTTKRVEIESLDAEITMLSKKLREIMEQGEYN